MSIKNKFKKGVHVLTLATILSSSGCIGITSTLTAPIYGGLEGFEKGVRLSENANSYFCYPLIIPFTTLTGIITGPFAGLLTGLVNDFYFIKDGKFPSELQSSIANPFKYSLAILEGKYPPKPLKEKQ